MTPEQHATLVQLAQQGLQRLAEQAQAALQACAPPAEQEAPVQEDPDQ